LNVPHDGRYVRMTIMRTMAIKDVLASLDAEELRI
jgi:hypothetical protein